MAWAILSLTAILGYSGGGVSALGLALNIGDFKSFSQYVRLQVGRHNLSCRDRGDAFSDDVMG